VKRTVLIAGIAGGVVIILVWYFVLFSPTSKDLNDTRGQVSSAQSQKEELQNTIRRLKALSRNTTQQSASLRTLRAAIPAQPDLGEFILQANDIAAAAGIDWLSIAPSPPVATGGAGPNSTIAVSMQINGGFFEVLDYLNRLEDLERLFLVDTVNVSTAGSDSGSTGGAATTGGAPNLSVTLTGRMFTEAQAAATGTPGTGTGSTTTPTTPTTTTPGGSTSSTTPPASSSGASS
jgi:Tfp pilus assembly protein PilO